MYVYIIYYFMYPSFGSGASHGAVENLLLVHREVRLRDVPALAASALPWSRDLQAVELTAASAASAASAVWCSISERAVGLTAASAPDAALALRRP